MVLQQQNTIAIMANVSHKVMKQSKVILAKKFFNVTTMKCVLCNYQNNQKFTAVFN